MLAIPHGTFCFMSFSGYGWYVSCTAVLLFTSYMIHNSVSWLKVRPFFLGGGPSYFELQTGKVVQRLYMGSLALTVPVWIFNAYNNFQWNNKTSNIYTEARPYKFLARDPWWVFTNITLLHIISRTYGLSVLQLVQKSPRLGIVLASIALAVVFTIIDVTATILEGTFSPIDGINPWWKLSLIFKCLTDAIILDDFDTELKRISDGSLPTARTRKRYQRARDKQRGQQCGSPDDPREIHRMGKKQTTSGENPAATEIENIAEAS